MCIRDRSYGWIETLRCNGSALEATPRAVEPAFAEMVNAERFNRISASFFLPDAPNNPVRGAYYLRHVGFLGAAAPAVKGLRKPQFSADSAGVITIAFALPQVRETTVVVNPPIQGSAMTGATPVSYTHLERPRLRSPVVRPDRRTWGRP